MINTNHKQCLYLPYIKLSELQGQPTNRKGTSLHAFLTIGTNQMIQSEEIESHFIDVNKKMHRHILLQRCLTDQAISIGSVENGVFDLKK